MGTGHAPAVGKPYQLHVVDGGIGALMLFALIVGALAPRGLRRANPGLLAVPLFLLANLGDVRVNLGSLYTGAAGFLAVYRTVLWVNDEGSDGKPLTLRHLAPLGACIMATSALRPSNAVPMVLFVGAALIGRRMRAQRNDPKIQGGSMARSRARDHCGRRARAVPVRLQAQRRLQPRFPRRSRAAPRVSRIQGGRCFGRLFSPERCSIPHHRRLSLDRQHTQYRPLAGCSRTPAQLRSRRRANCHRHASCDREIVQTHAVISDNYGMKVTDLHRLR